MSVPESLLFISTLDGTMHAVKKQTGDVRWSLKEGDNKFIVSEICERYQLLCVYYTGSFILLLIARPFKSVTSSYEEMF